jgi:cation diffusion facilitator CzcD-associated flavoprotein CzcO
LRQGKRLEADNVVAATGSCRVPRVPPCARELDPGIAQLHAAQYHNTSQLEPGAVLVVGVGNSGAEISVEVAGTHPTLLAGKERGSVPFDIDGFAARFLVYGRQRRSLSPASGGTLRTSRGILPPGRRADRAPQVSGQWPRGSQW